MVLLVDDGRCAPQLEQKLFMGSSAWMVDEENKRLVRRVSQSDQDTYEAAVAPADEISAELAIAWTKVYGRQPDASDAWDHAIKAVELCLWRIVTPTNSRTTLGAIIAALGRPDNLFQFRLATSSSQSTSLEALVQLLRLIWPNPDRHGTEDSRSP